MTSSSSSFSAWIAATRVTTGPYHDLHSPARSVKRAYEQARPCQSSAGPIFLQIGLYREVQFGRNINNHNVLERTSSNAERHP